MFRDSHLQAIGPHEMGFVRIREPRKEEVMKEAKKANEQVKTMKSEEASEKMIEELSQVDLEHVAGGAELDPG